MAFAIVFRNFSRTFNPPRLFSHRAQQTLAATATRTVPQQTVSKHLTITGAQIDVGQDMLKVRWEDGTTGWFPYVWLLDNAPTSKTFEVSENGDRRRRLVLQDLNVCVQPLECTVDAGGEGLKIRFPPYDVVHYPSKFLREHNYSAENAPASDLPKIDKVLWGRADLDGTVPRALVEELDVFKSRHSKLELFARKGILLIEQGTKHFARVTEQLKISPSAIAKLPWHPKTTQKSPENRIHELQTGMPYMKNVPNLVLIKMFEEPLYGNFQFVDGFRVAGCVEEYDACLFRTLSSQVVRYEAETGINQSLLDPEGRPILRLNSEGQVGQVIFNNALRSPSIAMKPEKMKQFYRALKMFNHFCYEKENLLNLVIKKGDLLLIDNGRILHGATAMGPNGMAQFSLGCTNWDFYSLLE